MGFENDYDDIVANDGGGAAAHVARLRQSNAARRAEVAATRVAQPVSIDGVRVGNGVRLAGERGPSCLGEMAAPERARAMRTMGFAIDTPRWTPMAPGCGGVVLVDGRRYAGFATRGEAVAAATTWERCWPAAHGRRVEVV